MNHYSDTECNHCNSTLYRKRGKPQCSGDNLAAIKTIFDSILKLESTDIEEFNSRVSNIASNAYNYDLFVSYWEKKKTDPNAILQCTSRDVCYTDLSEELSRLPIPDPYIPLPDLAEVYIAEIMLGRELTEFEKDGRRWIPKIDQETGDHYFAPLKWIRWPIDYISLKDMVNKTNYEDQPLDKVFDVDIIKGFYSNRRGDICEG